MGGPAGELDFPPESKGYFLSLFANEEDTSSSFDMAGRNTTSTNLVTEINSAITAAPLTGVTAFDPDTDLDAILASIDKFEDLADDLDHVQDWNGMVASALGVADQFVESESINDEEQDAIDAIVVAADERQQMNLARGYNRIAAGFFDINGVVSTVFPLALSNLERGHNNNISQLRTELELRVIERRRNQTNQRAQVFLNSVNAMISLLQNNITTEQNVVAMNENFRRLQIGAKTEESANNVRYDVDEATWDLKMVSRGLTGLSALNASPIIPEELSPIRQFLSGATASVSLGLTAVSAGAPVVGGVLAAGGALLGLREAGGLGNLGE